MRLETLSFKKTFNDGAFEKGFEAFFQPRFGSVLYSSRYASIACKMYSWSKLGIKSSIFSAALVKEIFHVQISNALIQKNAPPAVAQFWY